MYCNVYLLSLFMVYPDYFEVTLLIVCLILEFLVSLSQLDILGFFFFLL